MHYIHLRPRYGLLALLAVFLTLNPAGAQWFGEKTTHATQIADRVPRQSMVVVALSLADHFDPAQKGRELSKLADSLPPDARAIFQEAEQEIGESLPTILSYFNGNAYLTVRPSEIFEPNYTAALGLKNSKGFQNWFGGMLKNHGGPEAVVEDGWVSWDFTLQNGPLIKIGKGWVFLCNSRSEFDLQLGALQGDSSARMSSHPLYQEALTQVQVENSGFFLFCDLESFYSEAALLVKEQGMLELPESLAIWKYGVMCADFDKRETQGLMALNEVDNALSRAIKRNGTADLTLFEFLPDNRSTMAALDTGWAGHVLKGFLDSEPALKMFFDMGWEQVVQIGDPTLAFTGRLAFSSDLFNNVDSLTETGPFAEAKDQGQLTACKSNLKNIATALEMYSTDWSGRYPSDMGYLTPNYLRTIPECPAAGKNTYLEAFQTGPEAPGNEDQYQDYYYLECHGHFHPQLEPNYPRYDGIRGLDDGREPEPYDPMAEVEQSVPDFTLVAEVSDVKEAHKLLTYLTKETERSGLDGCQSNVKNIGTALEMYSTDWSGRYPTTMSVLTPNYLKTIPDCPVAKKDTYSTSLKTGLDAPGNEEKYQDYYYFECQGHNHPELEPNYPRYNAILGLETGPVKEVEPTTTTEPELVAPTTTQNYPTPLGALALDPARKLVLFATGTDASQVVSARRSQPLPKMIQEAVAWSNGRSLMVNFNDLQGAYEALLKQLEQDQDTLFFAQSLRMVKSWVGDLQDVQAMKATPEGIRYLGRGYNSSPGMGVTALVSTAVLVPNFIRAREQGMLTACKSNLKNLATGLEMWATDNNGEYPESMDQLTPDYLRLIPECPAAQEDTYSATYTRTPKVGDDPYSAGYKFYCSGHHHSAVDVPADHPQYNSVEGLVEQ